MTERPATTPTGRVIKTTRAGSFVQQASDYVAFEPLPLPPTPPLTLDGELSRLCSAADLALGRLDGVTEILPNPNLFLGMYVVREAVLSSQIEGTQASLTDVLQFEVDESTVRDDRLRDVGEVVNYVRAMNYGLERLKELPLSLRLIREIHSQLMQGVRGENRAPGEFRTSQNWVGAGGASLKTARYVPPPPHVLARVLGELEAFLHDAALPPLVQAGLAHAQFETIHPFLDGNGRMGRLLVTFLLCERRVLARPLLYLSHFLKRHRTEYYDRLQDIRDQGRWEPWIAFFLRGVGEVAKEACETAKQILALRERYHAELSQEGKGSGNLRTALDGLFAHPIISAGTLAQRLGVSEQSANTIIRKLMRRGILQETTGYKRNRRFSFAPYLALFEEPTEALESPPPPPPATLS